MRAMFAGSARRISNGDDPLPLSPPQGPESISQPLTFARIHAYLSMATPLLWMRQADTIGVLGLALNACDERSNGHREQTEQIRELILAARDLWLVLPDADEEDRPGLPVARLSGWFTSPTSWRSRPVPELRVNGHDYSFDAPVGRTLAETLRDDLGLTGTKIACGEGHCGACTVQLNGCPCSRASRSSTPSAPAR